MTISYLQYRIKIADQYFKTKNHKQKYILSYPKNNNNLYIIHFALILLIITEFAIYSKCNINNNNPYSNNNNFSSHINTINIEYLNI